MCGICGAIDLRGHPIPDLAHRLEVMSGLLEHRGPDDAGIWTHERGHVGFGHQRLSIIDPEGGHQPMSDEAQRWITYNGEVYNHPELMRELGPRRFRTACDTEAVLRAWETWGIDAISKFRGMFAFALWDEPSSELICVRDRFGIKPFYYAQVGDVLYFASEAKALLPFLTEVDTDIEGLRDYLTFQFCLGGKTLFKGVRELQPGHFLRIRRGTAEPHRYWEVYYDIDLDHTATYFEDRLAGLLEESVGLHLRSDVPVSAYVSGGLDSSAVASLAAAKHDGPMQAFTGLFPEDPRYDESRYARTLAEERDLDLHLVPIDATDFVGNIDRVIYHLDYPVAGPGSFPQFMVSAEAGRNVKVILGGQGGDEIFGGYTRYLVAYFEQCIKAAIDGTMHDGNFVVTYESIIPNLVTLRNYKPLLRSFWQEGLFDDLDARYFRLINRAPDLGAEVDQSALGEYDPFQAFGDIFNGENVGHEAYFDKMTHFDFKTLLPALLQVEDRVSMAHSLESRVPLLDHRLVELAATVPADVKFANGDLKHLFKRVVRPMLPDAIANRSDKMGFPVPLAEWLNGEAKDFVFDRLSTERARSRDLFDNRAVLAGAEGEARFGRKTWGLVCLELWQQTFHDRAPAFQALINDESRRPNEGSDHRRGRVYRLPSRRSASG